jgi:hypothetical protein
MIGLHNLRTPTTLVGVAVMTIAAVDWRLKPEQASHWMVAMAAMAVIWLVAALVGEVWSKSESMKRYIAMSATLAGVILAVALGTAIFDVGGSAGHVLRARVSGIVAGLVLCVIGNGGPKVTEALKPGCFSTAESMAAKRFTGWTFVVAGLAYALLWGLAPLPVAEAAAIPLVAGALLLALARVAWAVRRVASA